VSRATLRGLSRGGLLRTDEKGSRSSPVANDGDAATYSLPSPPFSGTEWGAVSRPLLGELTSATPGDFKARSHNPARRERSAVPSRLPPRTALLSYESLASQESPERYGFAVRPRGLCGGGQRLSRSWCRSPLAIHRLMAHVAEHATPARAWLRLW
jgi:hypothetical protein